MQRQCNAWFSHENVFLGRSDEWSGYQHSFLLSTCWNTSPTFPSQDVAEAEERKTSKSIFIYFLDFVRFVEVSHNFSLKFKSQVIPLADLLPFVSSILDRIHSSLETTPLKVEYVADATGTALVDLNKETLMSLMSEWLPNLLLNKAWFYVPFN